MRMMFMLAIAFAALWTSSLSCGSSDGYDPEHDPSVEKMLVETAVTTMMQEEGCTDLSKYADGSPTGAPVKTYEAGQASNDMASFPSFVWHIYDDGKQGYFRLPTTNYYYTVELDGTVRQFSDSDKTTELNPK